MAITLAGAVTLFGSIALFEGLAALLERIEGDPEADVASALQQLARSNQRRAFSLAAAEQAGAENIEQNFAGFNKIPSRVLSEAALQRQGPTTAGDTELLDYVSSQLRLGPGQLSRMSAPARSGDMSQVFRRIGRSLPISAPNPQQPQSGQPQEQPQGPTQGQ